MIIKEVQISEDGSVKVENKKSVDKIHNLNIITYLFNSNIYRLILKLPFTKRLKNNVIRWFTEMNTLTVIERVNYIFDNKYEENLFRVWFSISNIFVFLRSRFYEKSKFLAAREEKNQDLKSKVMLAVSFEEQYNPQVVYFTNIFLKNIGTRVIFFASRLLLYAYFIFAIIFRTWT
ncbi:MAG: hypothetical protein ACRDA3_03230, partial [Peptostreptococcaceae bacterium]